VIERRDGALNLALHLWGWPVAVYLFLGGLAAGLAIFASWAYLAGRRREFHPATRWATVLAPLIILVGLIVLWLDLGSKWTPFWLYLTFRIRSPMSWGAWILLAILLTSSLAAVPALRFSRLPSRLRLVGRWAGRRIRLLAWLNLVLGAALGLYTGVLLGTMVARPALNSPILPLLFLASGLSAAAAVLLLLAPGRPTHRFLHRSETAIATIELTLVGLYLIGLATSTAAGQAAAASLVAGTFAWVFWPLAVAGGMAIPLAVGIIEMRARHMAPALTRFTALLVLIGGLALRLVLVYAGQRGL
jgi:formate-dependent nitrite reductase membrane component NrfD